MADKKERFEVLLEAIQSDVKAVAEGQGGLRQQVNELKTAVEAVDKKHDTNFLALYDLLQDNKKEVKAIKDDVREIKENLQRVEDKLDFHIKLPAHA